MVGSYSMNPFCFQEQDAAVFSNRVCTKLMVYVKAEADPSADNALSLR